MRQFNGALFIRIVMHTFIYIVLLTIGIVSFSSQAIHLTTFRIHLDKEKPNTDFVVFNRDVTSQQCELSFKHYDFNETGQMLNYQSEELPSNSAVSWVRYSPRKFVLTPANSQTIRFSMRRKANAEPAEYRSYLVIDCGAMASDDKGRSSGSDNASISIQPKLLHNVPVIVRTGDVPVEVAFDKVTHNNDTIKFSINKSGLRSIYGKLELIDIRNNERVDGLNGESIYPETKSKHYQLSTKGIKAEHLLLRFTSDKQFGDDRIFEQKVIL